MPLTRNLRGGRSCALCRRLLRRPASESGRIMSRGPEPRRGCRRRRMLMLPILRVGDSASVGDSGSLSPILGPVDRAGKRAVSVSVDPPAIMVTILTHLGPSRRLERRAGWPTTLHVDQLDRSRPAGKLPSQRTEKSQSASPRSRRLVLPSECDRQLLATAATKLVAEHRDTILEFLNRPEESLFAWAARRVKIFSR